MKKIKINSEKQDNGIWGMPLYCLEIDFFPLTDERKYLIFSATITAIAEYYKDYFRIFNSTNDYYHVKVGKTTYKVLYDKYEVDNDILYEFDNDEEHKIFIRKQKLKHLNKKSILENIF